MSEAVTLHKHLIVYVLEKTIQNYIFMYVETSGSKEPVFVIRPKMTA